MNKIGISLSSKEINGRTRFFKEYIEEAIGTGFDFIEIDAAGFSCMIGGEIIDWLAEPFVEMIKQYRKDMDFILHSPIYADLGDDSSGSARGLTGTIELASLADIKKVIVHPTDLRSPHNLSIQKANLTEASWLADLRKVEILLETQHENPPSFYINLISDLNIKIGVCPNVGSLGFHHGKNTRYLLEESIDSINNIILSDNCGIPKPLDKNFPLEDEISMGWGELKLPIGAGILPLNEILTPIKNKPEIDITIEIMDRYRDHWKKILENTKNILG